MEITVSQEQVSIPVTVFQVDGRINMGNAENLIKQAEQAYADGTRDLVLVLSQVESMTSAGLRAILSILKLFTFGSAQGGSGEGVTGKSPHFKLAGPTQYVQMVLTTAGFDRYIEIHPDLPAALASF
jgi:anti-anti-sigma factor